MAVFNGAVISGILIACAFAGGCSRQPAGPDVSFDGARVKAHVDLLADDLYEGREAGTRGYDLAAGYVAAQFTLLGLQPGNDGNFYQHIEFDVASIEPGSRSFELQRGEEVTELDPFVDFTSFARLTGESIDLSAPLVFVGYGVDAPSIERNDYENLDLEGKIAVMVRGAPAALDSEQRAFYSSSRYHKFRRLQEAGAIGVVGLQHAQVFSEGAALRSSQARKFWRLDRDHERAHEFGEIQGESWLFEAGARKLFDTSNLSFDEFVAAMQDEDYVPGELGVSARIRHRQATSTARSQNVIGLLPGTDPDLQDEYVVLSAHLDGVGTGVEGIYNGYYDNASGIGVMLEVARALVAAPHPPRRSVLFLATAGEEKGLLGADHFAENPVVPIDSIVANVNMDMAMFLWRVEDIVMFGAQHSTLDAIALEAATSAGLRLSPDPFPERGYFTRSDQFPFVARGIPAVFLASGFGSSDPGVDPEAIYNNFMRNHYHGTSDDAALGLDTYSAAKVVEVNYHMTLAIANAASRPHWKNDDFFGDMFGTEITRAP